MKIVIGRGPWRICVPLIAALLALAPALGQLDVSAWPMAGANPPTSHAVVRPDLPLPAVPTAWVTTLDSLGEPLLEGSTGGPVVDSAGCVYYKNNAGARCYVYKFDPLTGACVALADLGPGFGGNRSAPVVGTDHVYAANVATNDIKVLSKSDLSLVGVILDPAMDPGSIGPEKGFRGIALGSVPNTSGNLNIYATRRDTNELYAFDSVTGALMWKAPSGAPYASGLGQIGPLWVRDGKQVIATLCGNAQPAVPTAIIDNGDNTYVQAYVGPQLGVTVGNLGALSADASVVYYATARDGDQPALGAVSTTNGSVVWSVPQSVLPVSSYVTSPIVIGTRIYLACASGNLAAVDDLGGSYSVAWLLNVSETGEFTAAAGARDSTTGDAFLYAANQTSHQLYVVQDLGATAEVIAIKDFGGSPLWGGNAPAVDDSGNVYQLAAASISKFYHQAGAQRPVADAGPDQNLTAADWNATVDVTLDGSASSDPDGSLVRYVWRTFGAVIADSPNPVAVVTLPPGEYDVTLTAYDNDGFVSNDGCHVSIKGPLLSDRPQVPGSIVFADIYGSSAYPDTPVLVSETTPLTILNQVQFGPWDPGDPTAPWFHFNFDADGNFYYASWFGRLVSFDKNLVQRWIGHAPVTNAEVPIGGIGNNTVIVGSRFVYVAGADNDAAGQAAVFAFQKSGGSLAWKTHLVRRADGQPVEQGGWRLRTTLWDDVLYVTGEVGVEVSDKCRIYMLRTETGQQFGDSLVTVELQRNGDNNPGNLVLVPDAFGPGLHGLYWNQENGNQTLPPQYCDLVGIQVNPATGSAATAWGPGSAIQGPYLMDSHVLYTPRTGRLYTPSYANWGHSLYVWDPSAANGAQLPATVAGASSHGYGDTFVIDDFTPAVTRLHAAGGADDQIAEMWTYVDDGVHPIKVERREFPHFGGIEFTPVGALQRDSLGRSVLFTTTGTRWWLSPPPPARVVALDLSYPLDDGPWFVDNIVIQENGATVFSEDFEAFSPGDPVMTSPRWTEIGPGNPAHTPIVVIKDGSQVVELDAQGNAGNNEWIQAALGVTCPTVPGALVTVEFDQYRVDLTDNAWPSLSGVFGMLEWDGCGCAYSFVNPDSWYNQGAALSAGRWQHVLWTVDFAAKVMDIRVDGQNDGRPSASWTSQLTFSVLNLSFDATEKTTGRYIQTFNAMYDSLQYPYLGEPWVGPSPGPDGTLYYMQSGADYQRRITRLGAAPAPTGACCLGDGTCSTLTQSACLAAGGEYVENGAPCAAVICTGRCCFPDGSCVDRGLADCATLAGLFEGRGSECARAACPAPEACCLTSGNCEDIAAWSCTARGGTPQGPGAVCASTPPCIGACCLADATCQDLSRDACTAADGLFLGLFSDCPTVQCPHRGACCFPDASCIEVAPWACMQLGGESRGENTLCADAVCTGACCHADGTCHDESLVDCTAVGGRFEGGGATCASVTCPFGACCLGNQPCQELAPWVCQNQGGAYAGDGVPCSPDPCPPNDTCAAAIPVAVPSVAFGDTRLATLLDPLPAGCGHTDQDGPDLWYELTGDGYDITIDMCAQPVRWDAQLAVYTGACDGLTCVVSDDDFCAHAGPSRVTWTSAAGESYLIRVFGWSYQAHVQGPFQLIITTTAPPTGACCFHSACAVRTAADCAALSGVYQGDSSTCDLNPCPICPADSDCTGEINFDDITYFVAALAGGENGWRTYYARRNGGQQPPCTFANCDVNFDGDMDFDDITPFVRALVNMPPCP